MAMGLDYDLDRERLKRRRAVTDAMIQQSMQPGKVEDRFIDTSPIAKVAQALFGMHQTQKLDAEEKALGERVRADTTRAIDEYTRKVTPRAAVAATLREDASGNVDIASPEQPAYTPTQQDRQAAAFDLMGKMGGDPRDTGKMLVAQALKSGSEG